MRDGKRGDHYLFHWLLDGGRGEWGLLHGNGDDGDGRGRPVGVDDLRGYLRVSCLFTNRKVFGTDGRVLSGGLGGTKVVVSSLVHLLTVLGEPHKVVEYFIAVLAFVHPVTAMGVYVCPQVVPTGVPVATDVAGERLLPRVYAHVSAEVGGAYELTPTHLTLEWTLNVCLGFLDLFFHCHVGDNNL